HWTMTRRGGSIRAATPGIFALAALSALPAACGEARRPVAIAPARVDAPPPASQAPAHTAEPVCKRILSATENRPQEARRAASALLPVPTTPLSQREHEHALLVESRRKILADPQQPPEARVLYAAVLWAAERNVPTADRYVDLPDEIHLVGTCEETPTGAWAI